jgi:hypothetical protein
LVAPLTDAPPIAVIAATHHPQIAVDAVYLRIGRGGRVRRLVATVRL